ncbi:MAG TPA: glycerophosphodiester phosphodiesterase family protein, partial [Ilumatobacteraceae bacterium]|nr:glycerophosphodiester phosphodiesterase family protein [Ilumatobacteraceae bacterium]
MLRVAVLLAAVALALPAAASAGPTDWTQTRTLNITHQGGENEAPSATMYAFERSMRLGADMLEVDVNTTKDDKLAIIHDGEVDRTTNGTGPVAGYTMAELEKLDAAHWFVPLEGATHEASDNQYVFRGVRTGKRKPPLGYGPDDFRTLELEELMTRYPDVPINIEIKGGVAEDAASYGHVAEVLAAFLKGYGRTEG